MSPEKKFIIISDQENNLVIFDIEACRKPKQKQIPWFPKAANFEVGSVFDKPSTTKDQREYTHTIRLVLRQTILRDVVGLNTTIHVRKNCIFSTSYIMSICGIHTSISLLYCIHQLTPCTPPQAMEIFNEYSFAIASGVAILIFQRERDRPFTMSTKGPLRITKIPGVRDDSSDDAGLFHDVDARVSLVDIDHDRSSFQFVANYDQLLRPNTFATTLRLVGDPGKQVLLVSFDDGNVAVFAMGGRLSLSEAPGVTSEALDEDGVGGNGTGGEEEGEEGDTEEHTQKKKVESAARHWPDDITEPPSLVFLFQAHIPRKKSPFQAVQLQTCPWATLPGHAYLTEFFTMGNDFKVVHWGVRCKFGTNEIDLLKNSFDVDMLGVSVIIS